jgi:hypothetical protein
MVLQSCGKICRKVPTEKSGLFVFGGSAVALRARAAALAPPGLPCEPESRKSLIRKMRFFALTILVITKSLAYLLTAENYHNCELVSN